MPLLMERIPDLGKHGTRYLLETGRQCVVEEKIDGSQTSFGLRDGRLWIASRREYIDPDRPPTRYRTAVEHIKTVQHLMSEGLTYRGEVVGKPRQVTLEYFRPARGGVVLFDVNRPDGSFLDAVHREAAAQHLGIDCVPVLHRGEVTPDLLLRLISAHLPLLGGERIEGVVVKDATDLSEQRAMAKFVADDFRETHVLDWSGNADPRSMVQSMAFAVSTPARFRKVVQTMLEDEILTGTTADIGPFVKRLLDNLNDEESEDLRQQWNDYWQSRPKVNHPSANKMMVNLNSQVRDAAAIWFKEELSAGNIKAGG